VNFALAAKKAGVCRIIYLGGLGDDADPKLSPHLRSRHEVGKILRDSGVETVEFRASLVIGTSSLEGLASWPEPHFRGRQPGCHDLRRHDPGVTRQRGLRRWLISVPVLTPYLSSLWLALVTPTAFEVGRHLIEGLKNPTVVRDGTALDVFPIRPMGIREAIQKALATASQWSYRGTACG
jgi:hypothetical protein